MLSTNSMLRYKCKLQRF